MPESPSRSASSVVTVTVESEGAPVDETVQLVSISVERGVNRIPRATLVVADGDMPGQDFPVSASNTFVPGAAIKISAGYEGEESPIFEGIVVRHGIRVTEENDAVLEVECRDRAVAMTLARRSACYENVTDRDVMGELIGRYGGLTAQVETTRPSYTKLVQYYCTDWDYLVSRAEVNGMLVLVDAGTVSVGLPAVSGAPVLGVAWGADLIRFEAEMDARWPRSSALGVSWDPAQQKTVQQSSGPVDLGLQGDISSGTLASALGSPDGEEALQTPAPLPVEALTGWAKARQTRADLARVRGRMTFEGSADAAPGTLIELRGVGSRFEGNVFAGSVRHEIAAGSWSTEVEFGVDPYGFIERKDVMAPPASGRAPGVSGLHIGVVKRLEGHPDKEPMVLVEVVSPGLVGGAEADCVWARLSNFYSSNGIGAFFLPEIQDEVVLGFLDEDPSAPVILGSVYSSKRAPPYTPADDNFTKGIVTRSELKLVFDDENKVVTVLTPAGNTVVLDDKEKSILVEDENGNSVKLSGAGIALDSPKDITITAQGKIVLDAVQNVEATSKADVKASGLNVSCEAQVGFTGKGSATAELSASGQTTVRGAMVMIN